MKSIFREYRLFFVFLFKFLIFYIVLTGAYKIYLNQFDKDKYEVDGVTEHVAKSTAVLMNFFNQEARTFPHETENCMRFVMKDRQISRIVEGCNAISVIILFVAFVFAFSNGFKKTFTFILIGSIFIYILNIIRISLLNYAFYNYPEYKRVLHDIFFPLFIYGVVFILWIVWIVKFSGYEMNHNKS